MPEPQITRDEIVVVDTVGTVDSYGNLDFTDKGGNPHRVNQKHSSLQPLIIEGKAVHLYFAEFYNKEYIHKAEAVELKDTPQAPPPEPVKERPKMAPIKSEEVLGKGKAETPTKLPESKIDRQIRVMSYSLAYAKDMACNGIIAVDGVTVQADYFLDWFKNKIKEW